MMFGVDCHIVIGKKNQNKITKTSERNQILNTQNQIKIGKKVKMV